MVDENLKKFEPENNGESNPVINNANLGLPTSNSNTCEKSLDKIIKVCSSEVLVEKDIVVVKVHLDRAVLSNVQVFNEYLKAELDLNHQKFIIDLSSTSFMDSTFLGSIVRFLKQLNSANSKLVLVVNYEKLQILAPIEQLKKILTVCSSLDEAISNLSK